MMQYAGPLNSGDMAIRANEVSPGIAALLSKQMRNKPMSGIYELPSAKPATPDFYNSALENVQNNLRNAARTVNALAPEGERLAYINPQEEGILRLLGGSGEPEPVTGIPSFQGFRGFTGYKDSSKAVNQPTAASKKSGSTATGPANTQFQQNAAGLAAAIKEATGPSYADQAKGAISSFIGSAGSQGGKYDPVQAAQALVDISKSGSAEQQALAKQENKALADALKYSLGSYDYGGKNLFGGFSLGDETKNILRAAETYGQLPRDKTTLEKVGDLISEFSLFSKLFGGGKKKEDMTIQELKDLYDRQDAMLAEQERQRDRGGNNQQQAVEEEVAEEEEVIPEDEIDFFNWYRRFIQPMSREDILARAYGGSTGPLLETIQEAKDSETA